MSESIHPESVCAQNSKKHDISSSDESEKEPFMKRMWKRGCQLLGGDQRSKSRDRKGRRRTKRHDSRPERVGPHSAIERRKNSAASHESGAASEPPQTRNENFPQRETVGAETHVIRQVQDNGKLVLGPGGGMQGSTCSSRGPDPHKPWVGDVTRRCNKHNHRARSPSEDVSLGMIHGQSGAARTYNQSVVHPGVDPNLPSPIESVVLSKQGEPKHTKSTVLDDRNKARDSNTAFANRPRSPADERDKSVLSTEPSAIDYGHAGSNSRQRVVLPAPADASSESKNLATIPISSNGNEKSEKPIIRCPFEALGEIFPEWQNKCCGRNCARKGQSMMQHVYQFHGVYCFDCFACFKSRTKKGVVGQLQKHVCQGQHGIKPAECLWRDKRSQRKVLQQEGERWDEDRWFQMLRNIAPELEDWDRKYMPSMYKDAAPAHSAIGAMSQVVAMSHSQFLSTEPDGNITQLELAESSSPKVSLANDNFQQSQEGLEPATNSAYHSDEALGDPVSEPPPPTNVNEESDIDWSCLDLDVTDLSELLDNSIDGISTIVEQPFE